MCRSSASRFGSTLHEREGKGKRHNFVSRGSAHPRWLVRAVGATPKGVAALLQITWIVFDSGFVQHQTQFFLIRSLAVMLSLIADIHRHVLSGARTDRENGVAVLPTKRFKPDFLTDPCGCCFLDLANDIGGTMGGSAPISRWTWSATPPIFASTASSPLTTPPK